MRTLHSVPQPATIQAPPAPTRQVKSKKIERAPLADAPIMIKGMDQAPHAVIADWRSR